jgi:hypothetical protein
MAIALATLSNVCLADDAVIGYVKTVGGDASVVVAGKTVKAEPGTPVLRGDTLKTGKPGSIGVTLKDNTILSVGPDTELVVDEYLYAPAEGQLKLAASMRRGSLNYVSGMIAKLKPEAVGVRTPSGNIGVRGTHFVLTVAGE